MKRAAALLVFCAIASSGAVYSEFSSDAAYHLLLARLLADQGQVAEAAESFIQTIELAPDDPFVRLEYCKFLMRQRQFGKAAQQAEAARNLAAEDPDVLKTYADTQMKLVGQDPGALDGAREALEKLRELTPWDVEAMVTLGQIYLSESSPSRAAEVFQNVLDRTSGNRMVYRLLVDALRRAGDSSRAEEVLRLAIDQDPSFTSARLVLAEILGEQRRHREAVEVLSTAPEVASDDLDLRKRLALELHRSGDFEGALAVIDRVLEEEPGYYSGLYLKTIILSVEGRNDEAIALAGRLLALHPDSLEVAVLQSRLFEREDRSERALELLERLEGRLSDQGEIEMAGQARNQRALVLARNERWEQLVDVLEPHLPELEEAGEVQMILLCSEAMAVTGQVGKAMALLSRFEDSSTAGRAALAKKAEISLKLDEEESGRELISQLIATGDHDDLLRAAEVFQRLERYQEAIPILEQAREQEPDSVQAMFWLAASYERSGRDREAEAMLEALLGLEPQFAPALNYLGYMWAEQGENLERALQLVRQAVNLEPDNGAYVDSLGWAHYQLGQYEEAKDYLERAASLVGRDAVVFEHLGDLYRVLGRVDDAREQYVKAIALDDENVEQVREKLDQLGGDL